MNRVFFTIVAAFALLMLSCASTRDRAAMKCPGHYTSFGFTQSPSGKVVSTQVEGYVHAVHKVSNEWIVGKFKVPGYKGKYNDSFLLNKQGTYYAQDEAVARLKEICDEL